MSNQKKYNTFRQTFKSFVYEKFDYDVLADGLHISFCFRLIPADGVADDSFLFTPSAVFEKRHFLHPERLSRHSLDMLVFNIGMIELISYWKAFCPPVVLVKPYALSDEQQLFWKKLYFNGLGEFFYTNGIRASVDDFLSFAFDTDSPTAPVDPCFASDVAASDNHIVPIGGGKDSVVTLELLTAASEGRPLPLIMNPRGATIQCVERAGYAMDDVIVIRRSIHPRLLEFNSKGALNGHTPFSAMLAFYSLLASALTGCRTRIALSNENSANESTVVGTEVNHQYSKSLEFEDDFRAYVAEFISRDFDYYSFLRPLSELQIAMLFSRYEHYYEVFKSCNVGSKTDIWCGHCAKCLFAYIILSPFIPPYRLDAIFGKNMLDDETLRLEFDQLRGEAETKPFECVGTVDEVNTALSMSIARWYPCHRPALLRDYQPVELSMAPFGLNRRHNLPVGEFDIISDAVGGEGLSCGSLFGFRQLFALLAFRRILIAGYGREGKSSEALLNRLLGRRVRYDIAHDNDEIRALLSANSYDLILKSPGIPSFFFDGLCDNSLISSQADLFLRVYHDITIGVTGTKGKSTTASLIHHILSHSLSDGSDRVILAGNIGVPLFDIIPLLRNDSIVVAELSCHQLENIRRAPHLGVLLNLYQEHLDHYRSYLDYKLAKFQIAQKQSDDDTFYYCTDNEELRLMVDDNRDRLHQRLVPFSLDEAKRSALFDGVELPLVGDHNLSNMYVVSLVVKSLGVSDEAFCRALSSFSGLDHRLQFVATVDGVSFYDDSISTIPQTTIAAVRSLHNVGTLILGGMDRGIDYMPLRDFLLDDPDGKQVANLVFFGSAGKSLFLLMEEALKLDATRHTLCHFDSDYSMEEAVAFAFSHTAKGLNCLLSPAASSYDHYKNFEHRGDHFKQSVLNHGNN